MVPMGKVDPYAGMRLNCTHCEMQTTPTRKDDDPSTVCRCDRCGKRHSTHSLEVIS